MNLLNTIISFIYRIISPHKKYGVYRFYQQSSTNSAGREWYIDLPKYPGPKSALQMVAGADLLLDSFSNGKDEVKLRISKRPDAFTIDSQGYAERLTLAKRDQTQYGRIYDYKFNTSVWLCPVVIYLFGHYPDTIYFQII